MARAAHGPRFASTLRPAREGACCAIDINPRKGADIVRLKGQDNHMVANMGKWERLRSPSRLCYFGVHMEWEATQAAADAHLRSRATRWRYQIASALCAWQHTQNKAPW